MFRHFLLLRKGPQRLQDGSRVLRLADRQTESRIDLQRRQLPSARTGEKEFR
jgi:hypothetical protein